MGTFRDQKGATLPKRDVNKVKITVWLLDCDSQV